MTIQYGLITKIFDKLKTNLQEALNNIANFYNTRKLKINPMKCETILFRNIIKTQGSNFKKKYKNFNIKFKDTIIPHNNTVKYLGVYLDKLLYPNEHLEIQLNKAKKAFQIYNRLFYSKHLSKRVKVLCYMTLVRPINK